jgi:type VI secretion system protein ImpM
VSAPGYFGKLPCRGDFVRRDLSPDFVRAWDAWLQAGMTASREALGEAWLDRYLRAPVWRWALAGGVAGELPALGVLLPSVDRVGRWFPFTLACPLPPGTHPLGIYRDAQGWLAGAEELALSVLGDGFDLDRFHAALDALRPPEGLAPDPPPADLARGLRLEPLDAPALAARLAACLPMGSLWWSEGGAGVAASLLLFQGLPSPPSFRGLLDGAWTAAGLLDAA